MTTKVRALKRVTCAVLAMLLVFSVGQQFLHLGSNDVSAQGTQLSQRSVTLSDSAPSGNTSIPSGVGSGTDVTYQVSMTTAHTAESVVIDFCANDPIIGDSCTAPTGMVDTGAGLTGVTGNITSPGWNITTNLSNQVILEMGSGSAATAGNQVFDLTGITNPSTLSSEANNTSATFYARIYTYAGTTPSYVFGDPQGTAPGTYLDYGGVALSVAQTITITARVQESLEFCISGAAQTTWTTTDDCSDPNAITSPAVILGHGSPTAVLDSTEVNTGTVYSQVSTNATNGVVIDMRSDNTNCGGLSADGDTTCQIPAIGATPAAITAGTADFGMFAAPTTDGTNGTGSLTIAGPYDGGGHVTVPTDVYYGMDTTANTGVTSTFGSEVASSAGPVYRVNDAYTFGATAALTTPAGIYVDDLSMIATGNF